jgi:transmembrane sensor
MEGYNDSRVNYELLGKFLSGECTPAEARSVEEWLAASPENPKILEALQVLWAESEEAAEQGTGVDVDAAWNKVQGRIDQNDRLKLRRSVRKSPAMWFIRIAAGLFLVACVGLVLMLNYFSKLPATELLSLKAEASSVTDTLPDGTIVTLNAHSELQYPKQFAGNERQVQLKGEAYFDVAHDQAHPFRIHAGAADVRVLGTSFNLIARGDLVKVAVQTGKVELTQVDTVAGKPKERVVLTKGMRGSYDAKTKAMEVSESLVENDLFWKTKTLVFQETPLTEVVAQLNQALGDSIVIGSDAIRNCPLTTTFEKPSIAAALNVIVATFNLQLIRDEKHYEIQGAGCN